MSDVEKINKRIREYFKSVIDKKDIADVVNYSADIQKIVDEELAKEPQECNSDLISRKKLIEDIETLKNQIHILTKNIRGLVPTKCDNVSAINEKCNNIMTEIYAFQIGYNQPQVPQWIPCSERLPEVRRYDNGEPKCYLAMIKGAKVPTELYVDGDGKWHDYCLVYYHHDYREFEVIAWQPLPQPYSESEDK